VASDLPADLQPTIEAAHIAAAATIKAAQIAADAALTNTIITVGSTLIALVGTIIAAYVAYTNVREPLRRADIDKEKERAVLLAQLQTSTRATLNAVDQALVTYKGKFSEPVEVRVLPIPATLESRDPKELVSLGPAINEAIVLVGLRLNDYRRAKAPIQDRLRLPDDDRPVILRARPDDFDAVVIAAEAYKAALNRLENLVSKTVISHTAA